MPCALKNAPANGARTMAKNEYLAKALTLLSLGTPLKQYLRPIAEISTSTVLPGMNQTIELSGTPACRSATSKPNKGCGDNHWPGVDADQQQPCYQNRATWPKRPHCLGIRNQHPYQSWDEVRQCDCYAHHRQLRTGI